METNVLYYGDNLDILRKYIPDGSVDLIYLDPPFNSKKDYNILFKEDDSQWSPAQVKAFEDTWRWDAQAEAAYQEVIDTSSMRLAKLISAMREGIGANDVMAYLVMMATRLTELHRVLKATGSVYLHCDPTMSHYLKLVLDQIFGPRNFRNEIVWHYRKWPTGRLQFQRNHDIIFFYSKSESLARTFNQLFMERAASTLQRFGTKKIISGRDQTGQRIPSATMEEDSLGVRQDDVWDIGRVPPIKQLFPTEKPLALLERIVSASSKEGDVVLDPFCGCGTALVASHKLDRKWIGIDITHLAIAVMKRRLQDHFPGIRLEIIGEPMDLPSAQELARQNRYQFQWWALSLIDARPMGEKKKGADKGVDGVIPLVDTPDKKLKRIVVSVKSGKVGVGILRELRGVIEANNDPLGILLTLESPTEPMVTEAAAAGFYESPIWQKKFPRLQILTIADIFQGKRPNIPSPMPPPKAATINHEGRQANLI
ncbi:MAG: restriction endonuclease [Chloroflexi bacterium]|nr:restriction endonuclease [Chloroflexota bacterium]